MKPIHYTHGMICGALELFCGLRARNAILPKKQSGAFGDGFDLITDIPITLDQVRRRFSR